MGHQPHKEADIPNTFGISASDRILGDADLHARDTSVIIQVKTNDIVLTVAVCQGVFPSDSSSI